MQRLDRRPPFLAATWLALASFAGQALAGSDDRQPSPAPPDREALERAFAENLSESVLEGTYTTVGEEKADPKPDRYRIRKVSKLAGDLWLFHAQYGEKSLPPLPLNVLWAGDAPVITMDDFTIPVLGTFSFRVLIDKDLYVGTWQHGKACGHMIGRIEKSPQPDTGPTR